MNRRVKLKEVCRDITVGHVGPMAGEYIDDGIPFLRSQNILPFRLEDANLKYISEDFHRRLKKSALSPGDVVVVRTGYPGTACVIPSRLPTANCADLVVIRPSNEINSHYLCCLFNSAWGISTVSGSLVGVAQQHFNIGVAKEMEIALPPIGTQRRVASVLSAYDDLIENNTRRIKILEEMAQMLYREWFVNFRFPGHEKVRMVESELGPIPEGWSVQTLGELAIITMGQSPPSESYNSIGTGLPFHQGVTDFGARFPTDRTYCTIENRLAEPRDILMSVRAPVGRLNISTNRIVIGRGLCAIRSKLDSQAILFQQLREHFREEDTMGSGTIFKAVTKQDVFSIKFISADATVAAGLESWLRPLFRELEVLSSKNANLRTTRDLLLPKLISGEIPVEAADEAAAELTGQTA